MTVDQISNKIASALRLPVASVSASLGLFKDECTIPFIARYRKELTGNLNEIQLQQIQAAYDEIIALEKRRAYILDSLRQTGNLNPELENQIQAAQHLTELEDLFLPYKPRRRTRAQIAIEQGLSGLADALLSDRISDPSVLAKAYINAETSIETIEQALQGAMDIVAERISEAPQVRASIRDLFHKSGIISCQPNKANFQGDNSVFRDYSDFSESIRSIKCHRFLAILRGESAKELRVKLLVDRETALRRIENSFFGQMAKFKPQTKVILDNCVADCFDRLLGPSIENEVMADLKAKADGEAIQIFAQNLREVLLASPLGPVYVLALDPGFRSGCKLVVLSDTGELLFHQTIYPLPPQQKAQESAQLIQDLLKRFPIGAIAIGNGTAGRETMEFCIGLNLPSEIRLCQVNESGASIYSASETARREFPDLDLTVRGAISIGRRLLDPLAELVKIDPKSIGVGQYQHDVDQKLLQKSLETIVISCVNAVGVDLNTASADLLQYVSGLSLRSAQAIINYRSERGKFRNRRQLLEITGIGPKTFEQSAGFLRIRNGDNPLDGSAVHPESYPIIAQMAKDLGIGIDGLIENQGLIAQLATNEARYRQLFQNVSIKDILDELAKPGRDPRPPLSQFQFDESIKTIADIAIGMRLPGIVTNVAAFGAFVDIGIHEQALIHISQMADHFVQDPYSIVKPGQTIVASVIALDPIRKRVSLSLKTTKENV